MIGQYSVLGKEELPLSKDDRAERGRGWASRLDTPLGHCGRQPGQWVLSLRWPELCKACGSDQQLSQTGDSLQAGLIFGRRARMREIVHIQIGQCGNQIGAKVRNVQLLLSIIHSIEKAPKVAGRIRAQQIYALAQCLTYWRQTVPVVVKET